MVTLTSNILADQCRGGTASTSGKATGSTASDCDLLAALVGNGCVACYPYYPWVGRAREYHLLDTPLIKECCHSGGKLVCRQDTGATGFS